LLICILGWGKAKGQDSFITYIQPQVALNYKVLPYYSHNFTVSSRNFLYRNQEVRLEGRNLDLTHFSTLKSGLNTSLGAGLMYRFRRGIDSNGEDEFRLTQQLNITSSPLIIRYGHRWRTEQRIFPELTIHRFRYRFTLDFPLEGEKVDVHEAYLILNTEVLLSVASEREPQYDQRFSTAVGWLLQSDIQVQAGVEYRLENFTATTRPVLFLNSSLIFSL
jgi:hypothetical protein